MIQHLLLLKPHVTCYQCNEIPRLTQQNKIDITFYLRVHDAFADCDCFSLFIFVRKAEEGRPDRVNQTHKLNCLNFTTQWCKIVMVLPTSTASSQSEVCSDCMILVFPNFMKAYFQECYERIMLRDQIAWFDFFSFSPSISWKNLVQTYMQTYSDMWRTYTKLVFPLLNGCRFGDQAGWPRWP